MEKPSRVKPRQERLGKKKRGKKIGSLVKWAPYAKTHASESHPED